MLLEELLFDHCWLSWPERQNHAARWTRLWVFESQDAAITFANRMHKHLRGTRHTEAITNTSNGYWLVFQVWNDQQARAPIQTVDFVAFALTHIGCLDATEKVINDPHTKGLSRNIEDYVFEECALEDEDWIDNTI